MTLDIYILFPDIAVSIHPQARLFRPVWISINRIDVNTPSLVQPPDFVTGFSIRQDANPRAAVGELNLLIAKQSMVYAEALAWAAAHVFPTAKIRTIGSGTALLQHLSTQTVDFLILGLNFIDLDGLDLVQQITDQKLARRVVVVTDIRDEWLIPRLQNTRIDAILDLSGESLSGVEQALHRINAGQAYVSPTLHSYLVGRAEANDTYRKLSPGELRVLRLIGSGQDNKEAGEALGLSESTVQTHRRNIMHKLNISTSPKLVREAIRLGLAQITYKTAPLTPALSMHH